MAARKQMGRAKASLGKSASRAAGAGAGLVQGRGASAKVRFAAPAAAPVLENSVAVVRQRMGVTQEVLGRMVGYSTRAIAGVESGAKPSPGLQRALIEAGRLYDHLSELIDRDAFAEWLRTPNPAFGDHRPLQLIEDGRVDRLWQMVHEVESGQLA